MIYEATLTYITVDKNGNDKVDKSMYVIEGCDVFAEVENMLYERFAGENSLDVVAIKRSKIKEIANARKYDDEKVYLSEVEDVYTDDNGEEKSLRYKILFYAKDFDSAKAFISEFIKQGFNMNLVSLKLTKFNDVIK